MSLLRYMTGGYKRSGLVLAVLAVLFVAACGRVALTAPCLADEPNTPTTEQDKTAALRKVAQNWISVGISQYDKGFSAEAEKSLLAAREYKDYLSADDNAKLEEYLAKAHETNTGRQAVLEQIKEVKNLLSQGKPVEARAYYEKLRDNPSLTAQERKQIAAELQAADASFDKQRKEITELYNRSVQLYRAGNLEKARQGFVEVAGYGLLVAPKGQSAEDYLSQIDSILAERLKAKSPAQSATPPAQKISDVNQPVPLKTESKPLQAGLEQQPAEKERDVNQQPQEPQNTPAEMADVATLAEPVPEKAAEPAPSMETRKKVVRNYTKAVVDDAAVKVEYYIAMKEFDNAVAVIRTASQVVRDNRSLIGDELFTQHTIRLKQLADKVVQVRKT